MLLLRRRCAQDKARVSVARLQRLTRGFGAFTVAGIQPTPGAGARPLGAPTAQLVSQPARDALRLVLSADGSYLQARRCAPWLPCAGQQAASTRSEGSLTRFCLRLAAQFAPHLRQAPPIVPAETGSRMYVI